MIIEKSSGGFRVKVPCKVNLFLEVLGKRSDNYHSLDTVMMAVSLVDDLEITPREDDQLKLSIEFADGIPLDGEDHAWRVPADQSNLIIRALVRLRNHLGQPARGANVRLIKRIPAMAGLGGGSADAAAALILGTLLWTDHLDAEPALRLASELGSDINFFLESHRDGFWLARCTGRGELVEPVYCSQPLSFVIVHPPRGCGTRDVFAGLQTLGIPLDRTDPYELLKALGSGGVAAIGGELLNRLESAAERTNKWIATGRNWIDRYDHLGQCMSGSGSARFCLCTGALQAEKIATDIRSKGGMRAYCVESWQSPGIEEQIRGIRVVS